MWDVAARPRRWPGGRWTGCTSPASGSDLPTWSRSSEPWVIDVRVVLSAARLELALYARDRLFVGLTILAALGFIAMVSLFGLTGSRAPMALVNQDRGPYGARFVSALERDHHSFALRPMDGAEAGTRVRAGGLAGSITI